MGLRLSGMVSRALTAPVGCLLACPPKHAGGPASGRSPPVPFTLSASGTRANVAGESHVDRHFTRIDGVT